MEIEKENNYENDDEEVNTKNDNEENEEIDNNEEAEDEVSENVEDEDNDEEDEMKNKEQNADTESQYKEMQSKESIKVEFNVRKIDSKDFNTFLKKDSNKGVTGLQNLGNSCYLNCAIQCLSHTIDLAYYFVSGIYKEELNQKSNLKSKFSELINNVMTALWAGNQKKFNPGDLKSLIGKMYDQFAGNNQQDVHEILVLILEALHEEFSKTNLKTYETLTSRLSNETDIEHSRRAWNFFTQRDNSIITDLFQGLLKTTINCQECHKQSISFDPFTNLSLSIPKLKKVEVTIIPFLSIQQTIKISLFITEESLFLDVAKLINYYLVKKVKQFRYVLINGNDSGKIIKSSENVIKISRKGNIICHEIDPNFVNEDFYTPICYFKLDDDDYFSFPKMFPTTSSMKLKDLNIRIYSYLRRYFDLPEEINKMLNYKYDELVKNYTNNKTLSSEEFETIIKEEYELLFGDQKEKSGSINGTINDFLNKIPYEMYIHQISTDKDKNVKEEKVIVFNGKPNEKFADSKRVDELINSIKKGNRLIINFSKANVINKEKLNTINDCVIIKSTNEDKDPSLRDCLQFFSSTEKFDRLNEWYCSNCKKTQQAYKKTEVFYTPKYLIINLKRFEYIPGNKASNKNNKVTSFNKIETNVNYPIKDFNFSEVSHNQYSTNEMFDLYGVIQHYGSQSGGHYTSICKNNNIWYEFNDNSVFKIEDEYVNSNSAYLLFYRKKT